jgi:hypothetical protein
MPENIGPDGAKYNTRIPRISENADIQTAFKLFHYGEGSVGLGQLNPNSIAGFLEALENTKISRTPQIIPINANLNNFTDSGFYSQNTNAKAQTGFNYPLVPPTIGFAYAGLLRVINDGTGNIYQEYQVAGIPTNPVYWRAFFGNLGWTPWQTFSVDGHVHDDRYFTKTQSDNRYFPAIKYLTIRTPTINNNAYTLQLVDESAMLLINNFSLPNTVFVPTDAQVNFVVGTQITILQRNTGQTTVVAASPGTTSVNSTPGNKLRSIWSSANLVKIGSNQWVLIGDLTA